MVGPLFYASLTPERAPAIVVGSLCAAGSGTSAGQRKAVNSLRGKAATDHASPWLPPSRKIWFGLAPTTKPTCPCQDELPRFFVAMAPSAGSFSPTPQAS